jgi:hypothetical protein
VIDLLAGRCALPVNAVAAGQMAGKMVGVMSDGAASIDE